MKSFGGASFPIHSTGASAGIQRITQLNEKWDWLLAALATKAKSPARN